MGTNRPPEPANLPTGQPTNKPTYQQASLPTGHLNLQPCLHEKIASSLPN